MITKERRAYINDNLIVGDRNKIQEKTSVPYSTIVNILMGRCYGKNGELVIDTAEDIIRTRKKKLEKEKLLYSKENKDAVAE